jgi:hypothetical protein
MNVEWNYKQGRWKPKKNPEGAPFTLRLGGALTKLESPRRMQGSFATQKALTQDDMGLGFYFENREQASSEGATKLSPGRKVLGKHESMITRPGRKTHSISSAPAP